MLDIPKNTRIKNSINASKNMRRFNDEEVQQIITDRKSGFTYKKLCEKYNTSNSTLFYLLNDSYYSGIKKIE
jgi:transposase-like protein